MTRRPVRWFEVSGVWWIARLERSASLLAEPESGSPGRRPEPGIWFENEDGECRFWKPDRAEGIPSASDFRLLSGRQLGLLLRRALAK